MSGRATALQRARTVRGVLLDHGVPEVSIELQIGRPTFGADEWNALQPVGVLSHHIASTPTPQRPTPGLALVKRGRSDLPGPLANGTAGVDLVYRILCLGWANHPGEGGALRLTGPCGTFIIPRDVGRPYLWGTEYEGGFTDAVWDREYTNRRTRKSMTFREFMGRCNGGLVEAIWEINGHGKSPSPGADLSGYHGEHKTWAPTRKVDRRNYTTESGRKEIRRYHQEEDPMPTPKDLWDHVIPSIEKGGKAQPARTMVAQAVARSGSARKTAAAALAQAKRNREAIRVVGQKLEKMAPGIAAEVAEALGDEIPDPTDDE